jgi:hypothetical protein
MNYTYGYDADYWNWCVANGLDPHEDASAERWVESKKHTETGD